MDYGKLLDVSAELGCLLMTGGAEIFRVEESVRRMLYAYGLYGAEVFAIPNCLIVSIAVPNGEPITRMRRIGAHGTNLELVERCNAFCRTVCAETPPPEEVEKKLSALMRGVWCYSPWVLLLGYGAAPAFFAPLFGGGVSDALCAFVIGLTVGAVQIFGRRLLGADGFFRTVLCSAIAALLALLLVGAGFGSSTDTVTISALMMLVPGAALTNAMREITGGDTVSAISRMAEVFLTALAIALGAAMGLVLGRLF